MIAGETELSNTKPSNSDEMTHPVIAVAVPMLRVIPGSLFSLLQFEPACTGCAV
jgi:hypothetical protein